MTYEPIVKESILAIKNQIYHLRSAELYDLILKYATHSCDDSFELFTNIDLDKVFSGYTPSEILSISNFIGANDIYYYHDTETGNWASGDILVTIIPNYLILTIAEYCVTEHDCLGNDQLANFINEYEAQVDIAKHEAEGKLILEVVQEAIAEHLKDPADLSLTEYVIWYLQKGMNE